MRAIFAAVLLVGLGLAGFAVYMAQNYIKGYENALAQQKTEQPQIDLVDGFIVSRAIKYGEKLEKKDVLRVQWPKAAMPDGMFTTVEEIFPVGDDRRRIVLRAMERGEVLISAKLTKPGEDAGINSRLERGQRAFALKVDVASGVSGFLRPGDRVDIYWTGSYGTRGSGTGEFTKLIEANVQLIAIDQTASEELDGASVARTVTVAASSQQVAAFAQAQSTGSLSLALVGAEDDTVASAIEVNQKSLLGIVDEVQEIVEIEKKEVCTIRTRKGAEVVQIPIPCTN